MAQAVIVVGGGVTGSEVAWRAARLGLDVTLVTTSLDTVYSLDIEPASLKPPPGSLLAEVIAWGAVSRWDVHRGAKYALEAEARVHLLQSTVSSLRVEGDSVVGVATWEGVPRSGDAVVLSVGTFLRARLEIGSVTEQQGRLSEMAYDDLYQDLLELGFTFDELVIDAPAQAGSLPHVVRSVAFSQQERSEDDMRLGRVGGLFAAGACVARPGGPPGPTECVAEGMRLADVLGGSTRND